MSGFLLCVRLSLFCVNLSTCVNYYSLKLKINDKGSSLFNAKIMMTITLRNPFDVFAFLFIYQFVLIIVIIIVFVVIDVVEVVVVAVMQVNIMPIHQ